MTIPARRIAYLAVSADGLITDRHGQIGWLEKFGSAEDFGFAGFLESVDALVMGRRTFDQVVGFGGAWPYGSRPALVLTHHALPANAPANARGASEEEITQALLGAPGTIWIVGGAVTLALCLRRGLIDELQLFVMPVLLGEGTPLTGRLNKHAPLTLLRSDSLGHGVIKLTYAVEAAEQPSAAAAPEAAPATIETHSTHDEEGLATGARADFSEPVVDAEALWPYPSEANMEKDA